MLLAILAAVSIATAPPAPRVVDPVADKNTVCALSFIDNLQRPAIDPSPIIDQYLSMTKLDEAGKAAFRHDCEMFQKGAALVVKATPKDDDDDREHPRAPEHPIT